MAVTYELSCRVEGCTVTDTFESPDAILSSDWTQVASLGAYADDVSKHRGFCPGHSFEGIQ